MILVTGGSASGKSEYAERLVLEQGETGRLYLATMQAWDEEGEARIARHRAMRSEKQFTTLECYRDLVKIDPLEVNSCMVLLECMSNLAANELFERGGSPEEIKDRILEGVKKIETNARSLIIVTNEVFSDDGDYSEETRTYLRLLGMVNQELSVMAAQVVEVVYGIPVWLKRGHEEEQK